MRYGLLLSFLEDVGAYIAGDGKVPFIPFQEDGNWERFLPKYEAQKDKFESMGCTLWGVQNEIEILHKRLYDVEPNYDEWFNYPLIPIGPEGNDPHVTHESIRKYGLVPAGTLKVPSSMKEALDLNRITGSHRAKGQNWLVNYDFKHEWVWSRSQPRPENYMELLKEALKSSPVGVSVTAWREVNGEYVSDSGGNNHWCVLYKFDENGNPWVFDTYNHSQKKLSKDHNIRRAKRIWLQKKDLQALKSQLSFLQKLLNALLMKKTLLQVCKENIGKDASPKDLANDSLGCAETVTTLVKQIHPLTPVITGTYSLYDYLNDPKNGWMPIKAPEPEAIILSVTGTGNGTIRGHAGIFDENLNIMSNSSMPATLGKFMVNFNMLTWKERYADKGGMKIHLYKKI